MQDPVVAAGLLTPDALGIREDQEVLGILAPRILLDRERRVLASRQELLSRDEDFAPARGGVVADDILDLLRLRVGLEGF